MPPGRPRQPTHLRAICDIARTSEYQVWVVADGVTVKLPRCEIDFLPGHVVMSDWVYQKIWRPTIEKHANRGKENGKSMYEK